MIAAILSALGLNPIKLAVIAGLIFAAAAGFFTLRQHYVNKGWDKALNEVKVQNDKAAEAASKAQRGVDACFNGGGVWDVITGKCQ